MVVRVKFFVNFRAFQSKIRAQINHDAAGGEQRHGKFRRDAVRQREKNHIGLLGQNFHVRVNEAQRLRFRMAGEFLKNLRERLPGILARGHGDQFRVRMVQEQLHQNFAGITGRADDGDFFRFHFQK